MFESAAEMSFFRQFTNKWLHSSARYFLFTALLMHFGEIFVCLLLGYFPLVWQNIVSCLLYIFFLWLEKRQRVMAVALAEFEVVIFALAATLLTGLDSGFYFYFICLLVMSSYLSDAAPGCPIGAIQAPTVGILTALVCLRRYLPLQIPGFPPPDEPALFIMFGMNMAICVFTTTMSVYLASQTLRRRNQELENANQNLEYIAGHDPLTGLQNRLNFYDQLEDLCRTADEDGSTFCVAMADIDNFKQFNDQYGHGHGDLVLISVADCIRTCVRETDSVCRWGGEEIVITFFNASSDTAREVLQSIRRELHALTAQGRPPFFREVTLTFGLAQHGLGQSAQELMSEADRLLYKGKQEGKNCIME